MLKVFVLGVVKLILFSLVVGCSNPQREEWKQFEDAKMINNLESQDRALRILRKIESLNPDAIYKGTSVQLWIEEWESTVRVYKEREKLKNEMWAY
ncbi:MAG: hypothetical protein ISQ09_02465 [Rubripirellula sp.]|jgi:hypothetical protein|nr:hypothetical protein [Rubripirellula sp.]